MSMLSMIHSVRAFCQTHADLPTLPVECPQLL